MSETKKTSHTIAPNPNSKIIKQMLQECMAAKTDGTIPGFRSDNLATMMVKIPDYLTDDIYSKLNAVIAHSSQHSFKQLLSLIGSLDEFYQSQIKLAEQLES